MYRYTSINDPIGAENNHQRTNEATIQNSYRHIPVRGSLNTYFDQQDNEGAAENPYKNRSRPDNQDAKIENKETRIRDSYRHVEGLHRDRRFDDHYPGRNEGDLHPGSPRERSQQVYHSTYHPASRKSNSNTSRGQVPRKETASFSSRQNNPWLSDTLSSYHQVRSREENPSSYRQANPWERNTYPSPQASQRNRNTSPSYQREQRTSHSHQTNAQEKDISHSYHANLPRRHTSHSRHTHSREENSTSSRHGRSEEEETYRSRPTRAREERSDYHRQAHVREEDTYPARPAHPREKVTYAAQAHPREENDSNYHQAHPRKKKASYTYEAPRRDQDPSNFRQAHSGAKESPHTSRDEIELSPTRQPAPKLVGDLYTALKVSPNASHDDLVYAARKRRIEVHPDRRKLPEMLPSEMSQIDKEAQEVGLAADTLCDEVSRKKYDWAVRRGLKN